MHFGGTQNDKGDILQDKLRSHKMPYLLTCELLQVVISNNINGGKIYQNYI
jgi:hypothetical protein